MASRDSTKKWRDTLIIHPAGDNGLVMRVLYVAYHPPMEGAAALPNIAGLKYEGRSGCKTVKDVPETVLQECRTYWEDAQSEREKLVQTGKPRREKRQVSAGTGKKYIGHGHWC